MCVLFVHNADLFLLLSLVFAGTVIDLGSLINKMASLTVKGISYARRGLQLRSMAKVVKAAKLAQQQEQATQEKDQSNEKHAAQWGNIDVAIGANSNENDRALKFSAATVDLNALRTIESKEIVVNKNGGEKEQTFIVKAALDKRTPRCYECCNQGKIYLYSQYICVLAFASNLLNYIFFLVHVLLSFILSQLDGLQGTVQLI